MTMALVHTAGRKQGLDQHVLDQVGKMLTKEYGIHVICEGTQCRTDGKTIYLPAIPPECQDQHLLTMVRSYLDHEAGHLIGKSDFNLFAWFNASKKYVEAGILNCLEDVRVEQIMADKWVGCGINLSYSNRITASNIDKQAKSEDAEVRKLYEHPLRQLTMAIFLKGKGMPLPKWIEPRIRDLIEGPNGEDIHNLGEIPMWADATKDLLPVMKSIRAAYQQLFQEPPPDQGGGDEDQSDGDEPGDGQSQGGHGNGGQGQGKGKGKPEPQSKPEDDDKPSDQEGESESDGGGEGEGEQDGDGEGDAQGEGSGNGQGGQGQSQEPASKSGKGGGGAGGHCSAEPVVDQSTAVDMAQAMAEAVKKATTQAMKQDGDFASPSLRPDASTEEPGWLIDFHSIGPEIARRAEKMGGAARQRLSQLLLSESRSGYLNNRTKGSPDPRAMAKLATGVSDRVMRRRFTTDAPDTAVLLVLDGSGSMYDSKLMATMVTSYCFASMVEQCGHKVKCGMFVAGGRMYVTGAPRNQVHKVPALAGVDQQEVKLPGVVCGRKGYATDGNIGYVDPANPGRFLDINTPNAMSEAETATGRAASHNWILKDWGVSVRAAETKTRFAAPLYLNGGGTPMGQSMIHFMRELGTRPEKRKIMFVMTDGQPDDKGNVDSALRLAKKYGVEVVMIGILTNAVESLHSQCAVINSIETMDSTVMESLAKALGKGR